MGMNEKAVHSVAFYKKLLTSIFVHLKDLRRYELHEFVLHRNERARSNWYWSILVIRRIVIPTQKHNWKFSTSHFKDEMRPVVRIIII